MKNVLVISAHPDDMEMSCSGTVAKLIDGGAKVTNLILVGNLPHSEYTLTAAGILGVETIYHESPKRFTVNDVSVKHIEELVGIEYDLIITHWKEDWHQDHRACHELGNILARKQPVDLWYMSSHPYHLKYKEFNPNVYVDVERYYVKKLGAIKSYKNISTAWKEGIQGHDKWRGSFIGTSAAEVFMSANTVL